MKSACRRCEYKSRKKAAQRKLKAGSAREGPPPHEVLEGRCREVDPLLLRDMAVQLEAIRSYEDLVEWDPDTAANPQQRRVWLDAGRDVTKILESRRAEKSAEDRFDVFRGEFMARLNMTTHDRQAAARAAAGR